MTIANNIRYLRKKHNYSQDKLAELLGYKSFTTIQKWESGVSEPPLKVCVRLAELFGVDVDDLVGLDLTDESTNSAFYIDPDAAAFAQEISERPGLRALFSAARDVKEEDLRFMVEMAERFKKESGED